MLALAGRAGLDASQGFSAAPGARSDRVLIRVGLATDLDGFSLPCCQPVSVRTGDDRWSVEGAVDVRPAGVARTGWFALQLAALKDEGQANGLRQRLEGLIGVEVRVVFDVASSLYRVRAGRFQDRDAAERLRARLAERSVDEGWIVREGGGLDRARLRLMIGDRVEEVEGRWVVLEDESPQAAKRGLHLERGRFRGRILLYLNERGLLNLINELPLEEYLRGVVPLEMGPELYDHVESLKAQAVAARTFTLGSLGGFEEEGFDICASPRCQVYGGRDVEHPRSDRAVEATAGEVVVHGGELAEALYSSSCGGFTENVETIFPRKPAAAYLRGVPCPEAGARLLEGSVAPGTPYAAAVMSLLVPEASRTAQGYQQRLEALATLAAVPLPNDVLASLERREVRRFVASLFDLGLDARLLRAGPLPAEKSWSASERSLHRRLTGPQADTRSAMSPAEMEEVLLELALALGVLSEERAYFLDLGPGSLRVRSGGRAKTLPVPEQLAVLRRQQRSALIAALRPAPGDRLRLLWHAEEERLVAVIGEREATEAPSPPRKSWRHFRGKRELGRTLRTLYPGFELEGLEVVSRGISGRIGALRLRGGSGDSILLRGLAIRWTLDTPDTWFTIRRASGESEPGWLLEGRGHGHGVGMCQLGAVLMAQRGHSYREILAHYYTGAKLGRLRSPGL